MTATIIEIPRSAVVLLVGPAGAGKSTFAARLFPADSIIASDTFREAITGAVGDQSANDQVFAAVHRALDWRLASGQLAVVDATNVTTASRRAILGRAARVGVPVVAIVFAFPAPVVRARNAERPDRRVPDEVVERHLSRLDRTIRDGILASEGYARVIFLRDPATVDRTSIRLVDGAGSG